MSMPSVVTLGKFRSTTQCPATLNRASRALRYCGSTASDPDRRSPALRAIDYHHVATGRPPRETCPDSNYAPAIPCALAIMAVWLVRPPCSVAKAKNRIAIKGGCFARRQVACARTTTASRRSLSGSRRSPSKMLEDALFDVEQIGRSPGEKCFRAFFFEGGDQFADSSADGILRDESLPARIKCSRSARNDRVFEDQSMGGENRLRTWGPAVAVMSRCVCVASNAAAASAECSRAIRLRPAARARAAAALRTPSTSNTSAGPIATPGETGMPRSVITLYPVDAAGRVAHANRASLNEVADSQVVRGRRLPKPRQAPAGPLDGVFAIDLEEQFRSRQWPRASSIACRSCRSPPVPACARLRWPVTPASLANSIAGRMCRPLRVTDCNRCPQRFSLIG